MIAPYPCLLRSKLNGSEKPLSKILRFLNNIVKYCSITIEWSSYSREVT